MESEYVDWNEFSEPLAKLVQLQQLKLHFDIEDEHKDSLVKLVQTYKNLQRLDLVGWKYGQGMLSMVVDIVRKAKNLKKFHLHKCGIYATKSLVGSLAAERKPMLQQSGQLHLFFDRNKKKDLKAVHKDEITKYLDIKWNCKHFNY